jgi:hypothetical protein
MITLSYLFHSWYTNSYIQCCIAEVTGIGENGSSELHLFRSNPIMLTRFISGIMNLTDILKYPICILIKTPNYRDFLSPSRKISVEDWNRLQLLPFCLVIIIVIITQQPLQVYGLQYLLCRHMFSRDSSFWSAGYISDCPRWHFLGSESCGTDDHILLSQILGVVQCLPCSCCDCLQLIYINEVGCYSKCILPFQWTLWRNYISFPLFVWCDSEKSLSYHILTLWTRYL